MRWRNNIYLTVSYKYTLFCPPFFLRIIFSASLADKTPPLSRYTILPPFYTASSPLVERTIALLFTAPSSHEYPPFAQVQYPFLHSCFSAFLAEGSAPGQSVILLGKRVSLESLSMGVRSRPFSGIAKKPLLT